MAISPVTAWNYDVIHGSPLNGGGFIVGSTGQNKAYSGAGNPPAAVHRTDIAVDAVLNTVITSAATPFGSSDVGNTIQVLAGGTVGFYQVTQVAGVQATLDRSPATTGTTGITANLGGALSGPADNTAALIYGNRLFLRNNATYPAAATITIAASGVPAPSNAGGSFLQGYASTWGDGGMASLQATASSVTILNFTGNGWELRYLALDGNAQAGSTCVATSYYSTIYGCLAKNFATNGFALGPNNLAHRCEATGGLSGSQAFNVDVGSVVLRSFVHDNAGPGFYIGGGNALLGSIITYNLGTTADGVQVGGSGCIIEGNTIAYNGRHGLYGAIGNIQDFSFTYLNNAFEGNGQSAAGYDLYGSASAGLPAEPGYDGNAYGPGGPHWAGRRFNLDDAGTASPINAAGTWTNTRDVVASVSMFVNPVAGSTGNWALNGTVGGGAVARGVGLPQSWPCAGGAGGLAGTTSSPAMGAVQLAAGSAGGMTRGRTLHG